MKAILLVTAIVLTGLACGQGQGNPSVASPTSGPLLFAVLQGTGTASPPTYNMVGIAGLDGHVLREAPFTPPPLPKVGCAGAVLPQSAHVAAGKVFFADASGVVRSLATDGAINVAATFPVSSTQQILSFAVSPDGARLLGTIFTIPTDGFTCTGSPGAGSFTFDAYTAPSGGSSHLVYHQSWAASQGAGNVLALTGWDAVGPIGTYPTVWATQGGGPGSTLGVLVRVDAATVKPLAQLADPSSCRVWDSTQSGAFVCLPDAPITGGGTPQQRVAQVVSVRAANGTELWRSVVTGQNTPFAPYLAPDEQHVVICCNDLDLANSHELLIGRDGSKVNLPTGFHPSDWLDSTTTIGTISLDPLTQAPSTLAYIVSTAPGSVVSVGLSGLVVGTVRG